MKGTFCLSTTVLITLFVLVVSFDQARAADNNAYSTKYDNFDVLSVLSSKRLVSNYGNCLLDRSPCTPQGKFLKGR